MHLIEGDNELDTILNRSTRDDLFFIISLSGDNETAVTLAKVIRKMHTKSIGIAMNNGNLLSKYCDEFIGIRTSYLIQVTTIDRFTCSAQYFNAIELLFYGT